MVAGERLEQGTSILAPVSDAVAFSARLGVASTPDGATTLAEQGELLVTPLRHGALSLNGGVGARWSMRMGCGRVRAAVDQFWVCYPPNHA